jgi:hypothetical protein
MERRGEERSGENKVVKCIPFNKPSWTDDEKISHLLHLYSLLT